MKTKQLPTGWKEVELREITESISAGGTPRRDKKEYWENGTIPWVKISDMKEKYISKTEEKITDKGLKNSSANLFPKGTLIYSIFASLGTIGILEIDATTNQAIAGVIPKKEVISTKYLYYCLRAEKNKILSKKSHATQDNLNLTILRNHKIPLPPLPIQKQIVSILEKAEKLKQRREKADKLTKEYLQSVFYEMFYNKDFEQIELGDKKICEIAGEYGSGASAIEYDGKVRYIRITDINEDGNLKDENVSPSKIEEKYFLEDGDLLFARSGATVGKTYLCKNKDRGAQYAGYLIRFRFNKKIISPEYIYYFTKTQKYLSWIKSKMKVVAQPNINAQQYSSIEIPLPPLPLQQKFASIVEKVEKMKEKQKKSKEEINLMFDALMQKAFKGELVR